MNGFKNGLVLLIELKGAKMYGLKHGLVLLIELKEQKCMVLNMDWS